MKSRFVSVPLFRIVAMVVIALGLAHVPLGVAAEDIKDALSDADTGLVDDNAYVSPQFGAEVAWGADWSANTLETVSNPEAGWDQLRLNWSESSGTIHLIWMEEGRGGPTDDVAYWTSDAFLGGDAYAHVDVTTVLLDDPGSRREDGAVLIGLADAGDPTAYLHYAQSVATDDGGALYLVLDAPVDAWPDVLESAQESVTIEGDTSFDVFDIGDVEEAVDDAPAVEYQREAAGLVEDDTFVGPAFGYEVSWPESWALSSQIRYPVLSKAVVDWDEVHIADTGTEADPPPFFDFYALYPRQSTAEQELAVFVDPDWVSLGFREDVEVTALLEVAGDEEAEALVAVTFPETGEIEYIWFRFARDHGECDLYFYLKARSEDFEDTWATLTDGITLNGDAIDTMITWDEIEDAIAAFEE